jgi:hypothetical protein
MVTPSLPNLQVSPTSLQRLISIVVELESREAARSKDGSAWDLTIQRPLVVKSPRTGDGERQEDSEDPNRPHCGGLNGRHKCFENPHLNKRIRDKFRQFDRKDICPVMRWCDATRRLQRALHLAARGRHQRQSRQRSREPNNRHEARGLSWINPKKRK